MDCPPASFSSGWPPRLSNATSGSASMLRCPRRGDKVQARRTRRIHHRCLQGGRGLLIALHGLAQPPGAPNGLGGLFMRGRPVPTGPTESSVSIPTIISSRARRRDGRFACIFDPMLVLQTLTFNTVHRFRPPAAVGLGAAPICQCACAAIYCYWAPLHRGALRPAPDHVRTARARWPGRFHCAPAIVRVFAGHVIVGLPTLAWLEHGSSLTPRLTNERVANVLPTE